VEKEIEWYRIPAVEVFKLTESSPQGITDGEAAKRLALYGYNEIEEEKRVSEILRFLSHFNDPLIYVLIVSGLLTFFLHRYIDTAIIFAVVLINAVIGYAQERKAKKTIEALKKIVEIKARVIRNSEREISAKELVPGDVIVLEAGMKVPADARLFEVRNLSADESLLTGESTPVEKFSETILEKVMVEKHNMVFAGTLVVEGYGKAVVVATSEKTELGKIAKTVKREKGVETPLLRRIKHLGRIVFFVILAVSILNFATGVLRGYEPEFMFLASVSLAVAAIPESLPALVTMSLAIGVRDMANRKAIVRRLPAVETLGSVTTICSDKTGTLTQNRMSVVRIFAGDREYEIKQENICHDGSTLSREKLAEHHDLYLTIKAGYICNKAVYRFENGKYVVSGDPTEIALLEVSSLAEVEGRFEIVDEVPFDSALRYMATAVKEGEMVGIYVKGSPEKVLSMCGWASIKGHPVGFDAHHLHKISSELAYQGLRVLAFAYKFVDSREFEGIEDHLNDLIFLGFQCMVDPPREECYKAVKNCREAGVRVIMITGDHPNTASFIAKDLGIHGGVATGDELEKMSDDELKELLKQTNVLARTLPELKLRIVKLLQEMKEIVAVTGDGVNDAPALKRADIGIAMGSGTEVAKESAEIILLDDNFATIVEAIDEGRNVFRKIQKILAWLLPTNIGEGLVVLAAFLLGIALPILPVQILWINTVTAVLLGTTLVFEPREPGLLKLRPITGELINPTILFRIVWVSFVLVACAYFLYFRYSGDELVARTVTMNTIVFFEIFYLLSSRSIDLSFIKTFEFKNRTIYLGIAAMILLQLAATYLPQFNSILQTTPLDATTWIEIIAVSSLVFIFAELEKYVKRNTKFLKISG